jgi:predicted permease
MISGIWRAIARVRSVSAQTELDRDFDDEAAAHIQIAIDEFVRAGMSEDAARRTAVLRFGGVPQARERHRDARGLPILEVALQDLRYSARMLRRDPGFALVAVLVLGLGIGANAAVFSIVNQILLRPLPFKNSHELVWIEQSRARSGLSSQTYSVDAYERFRARSRSFTDVSGYFPFSPPDNERLTVSGESVPITTISVLANFFSVLRVEPAIGRLFTPEETRIGGRPAALLSYPFWRRRFAADPQIVGRVIDLSGHPVTVIGVLPEQFDFGSVFSPGTSADAFVPIIPDQMRDWGNTLSLLARLAPGVSVLRAGSDARSIAPELPFNAKHPEWKSHYTATVVGLKEHVSGQLRRALVVLWSAVGFTLLIVCVNLANLLIGQTGARSKELAMRAALGADRGRLARQLLTESAVLAAFGGALGLGIAWATITYVAHRGTVTLPLLNTVRLDGAAMAWTLLLATASTVVFGLAPAMKITTRDVQSALKEVGPGMSSGRGHHRLRASLVVSEIALACVLLVGAGLLLRSFVRVLDVDLGFRPMNVAAIKVDDSGEGSADKRSAVLQDLLARVQAIPGVQMAGVADNLPLERNRSWGLSAKGKHYREGELRGTFVYVVTPGYLETMGVRLEKGRTFTWSDGSTTQPVVVINESAARYLWPGENPVDRIALVNGRDTRVIGVVADVHESSLESTGAWQMYLPVTQAGAVGTYLAIRSTLSAASIGPNVMRTLRALNPTQSATQLRPIQASVDRAVSPRRFFMLLVAAFAAFGLLLAALGVYGVISYSVTQRRQEIGIRMALGATASQVRRSILWETMRLATTGAVIGAIAAAMLSRLIASLLFETAPTDPVAFAATVILLAGAAFVAAMIPAGRASRVDPMQALRPS